VAFPRAVLWLLLLALAGSAGCRSSASNAGDDLGPVGSFSLTERSGQTITDADLRGKVWVASFIFVRCTGPCPQVTQTMQSLQKKLDLKNRPDLRLVTFTVDPERDQPDELKAYADRWEADRERWLFLTGTEKEIHRLLNEGFKVATHRNASPTRAGDEFSHSTRLVVVDKKGHIRGYYHGVPYPSNEQDRKAVEQGLEKLAQQVSALLKEKP